jgi:phage gp46-like protein
MINPIDIRTVSNSAYPNYSLSIDWQLLSTGEIDATMALATAVVVALGTNALADESDPLPDPDSTDREGWWGDFDGDVIWNAWPIGTKLWLLRRSAIESAQSRAGSTQAMAMNYIRMAIQPFVDNKIASTYEIVSMRVTRQQINAIVRLYRGPRRSIDLMYQMLWDGMTP